MWNSLTSWYQCSFLVCSRYVCCAGYMPCSGRCGESKCPEFCLATEVRLLDSACYHFLCLHILFTFSRSFLVPCAIRKFRLLSFKNAKSKLLLHFTSAWSFFFFLLFFVGLILFHYFQVICCFGNSVASTRFLLQDEFNIQTTQCDNCIIVLSLSLSIYLSLSLCMYT